MLHLNLGFRQIFIEPVGPSRRITSQRKTCRSKQAYERLISLSGAKERGKRLQLLSMVDLSRGLQPSVLRAAAWAMSTSQLPQRETSIPVISLLGMRPLKWAMLWTAHSIMICSRLSEAPMYSPKRNVHPAGLSFTAVEAVQPTPGIFRVK